MLSIRFVACALVSLAVTTPVAADKVAIRAPVGCRGVASCGEDISLDEAKDSYRKLGKGASDLKTLTDRHVCEEFSTTGFYYYWAPLERFSNGGAALAVLRNRARDRSFFNGYMIVESDKSTDSEQHLALCSVSKVSNAFGPPRYCVTVAIITPRETWLRGGDRNREMCYAMASFRDSGAIDITFNVKTRTDPLEISAALLSALKRDFDLSAEQEVSRDKSGGLYSIYIRSSASLRNSKILQAGWREAMDFDLHIDPTKDGVSIRGAAHALVCRQALGNLVDYRAPDDSQRAIYAAAIDSGVDSAIRSSCKRYQKQDAKTIICGR